MSALNSMRIEPNSLSIMPTADGGAVLTIDSDIRVILKVEQTNAILRGLLAVATIKIEPNDQT